MCIIKFLLISIQVDYIVIIAIWERNYYVINKNVTLLFVFVWYSEKLKIQMKHDNYITELYRYSIKGKLMWFIHCLKMIHHTYLHNIGIWLNNIEELMNKTVVAPIKWL